VLSKNEIGDDLAINLGQVIDNKIGDYLKTDLYHIQPITPLEFLTDPDEFDQKLDEKKLKKTNNSLLPFHKETLHLMSLPNTLCD